MDAAANETGALVILVEEEPDERSAMSRLLRAAGFSVAAADTTDQALHLLESSTEASALVTDAHVPGEIDGWELAQRVRQSRPELAVVLISGHSDPTSGPLPDSAEFILKPNVVANLVPTLQRLTKTR